MLPVMNTIAMRCSSGCFGTHSTAPALHFRYWSSLTELNALNAVMAVIRFKQHFRLLERLGEAT
jgi:hypothetical protein